MRSLGTDPQTFTEKIIAPLCFKSQGSLHSSYPPETESGYFMTAEISPGARDMIPERYFRPNVNYEDDKDTIVK